MTSVAALAVRLRLGGAPGAPPQYVVWGQAVRLVALVGLLVNAVMATIGMAFLLWSTGRISWLPAPPHWASALTDDPAFLVWVLVGLGVSVLAYLALVFGHRRVAMLLTVLAKQTLRRLPPVTAGPAMVHPRPVISCKVRHRAAMVHQTRQYRYPGAIRGADIGDPINATPPGLIQWFTRNRPSSPTTPWTGYCEPADAAPWPSSATLAQFSPARTRPAAPWRSSVPLPCARS